MTFLVFSLIAGGMAVNGKIIGAHYYLGAHGNYPEVSRATYVMSALLSAAFGFTLPIFAGVMVWCESREPTFNPLVWIGPLLAVAVGLVACYLSMRCIVTAFGVIPH